MAKGPQLDIMRSPLGRARGLGAAKAGAAHWWAQRLTAIALVPLTLWFLCSVIRLLGATRDDVAREHHERNAEAEGRFPQGAIHDVDPQ